MRKWLAMVLASVIMAGLLAGCGSGKPAAAPAESPKSSAPVSYKDGKYTAKSSPDDDGAVGEITLSIEQGKITKANYKGIKKDGTVKDVEYGKTHGKIENQDFYNKAQQAVKGADSYGPKLVETQKLDQVDSVSGATTSYKQFVDAVKKALAQAVK